MAATLGDWIGLILISALAYAIYTGVRSSGRARQMLEEQKSALQVRVDRPRRFLTCQAKGVSISSEGVSIKSNHAALDRDAYIVRFSRACPMLTV